MCVYSLIFLSGSTYLSVQPLLNFPSLLLLCLVIPLCKSTKIIITDEKKQRYRLTRLHSTALMHYCWNIQQDVSSSYSFKCQCIQYVYDLFLFYSNDFLNKTSHGLVLCLAHAKIRCVRSCPEDSPVPALNTRAPDYSISLIGFILSQHRITLISYTSLCQIRGLSESVPRRTQRGKIWGQIQYDETSLSLQDSLLIAFPCFD